MTETVKSPGHASSHSAFKSINTMNTRNSWIQILRAIASIMVLLFHARPHIETSNLLRPYAGMFDFFFSGVDVFFVLSGFVVYRSATRSRSAIDFAKNRLVRIFSGYWPAFLLLYLLPYLLQALLRLKEFPSWQKILTSLFLLSPDMTGNMVPTAWSLALELWFYAWVFIGLCFFKNSRKYYAALLVMLLAWNIFFLKWHYDAVVVGLQPLRHQLTGMGIEFLLGAFAAMIFDDTRMSRESAKTGVLLFLVTGVMAYTMGTLSPWHDRVEFLRAATYGMFGLSALMLVLLLHTLKVRAVGERILVAIGDASFSLYLIHPFLLGIFGSLRSKYVQGEVLLAAYNILMIPAIIALSFAWYVLMEKPAQARISRLIPISRSPSTSSLSGG